MNDKAAKRYGDAYLLAGAITTIGNSFKVVGVIFGFVVILAGFYVGVQMRAGLSYTIGGAIGGIALAVPFYLLGIIVAAQGQLLKATLDTAVNTSPFLDPDQKARAMSLI